MNQIKNKTWLLPPLLGLGHGINDCISGYVIGMFSSLSESGSLGFYILLYNVLAFAGQVPAGMLFDKLRQPRAAVGVSLLLGMTALWMCHVHVETAVILAGIGSAGYHVAGGMVSLTAMEGKATGAGIFAGPGVVGLALGGGLAAGGADPRIAVTVIFILLWFMLMQMNYPAQLLRPAAPDTSAELHDLVMIALLLGIGFRSAIWNVFNAIHLHDYQSLVIISAAACTGKIAGGFFAEWLGWRAWSLGALAVATPLLAFGGNELLFVVPGIFFLQSVTGVAIAGMYRAMPSWPGMAVGLSVGLAIALGGIPGQTGFSSGDLNQPWIVVGAAAVAGGLFWVGLKLKARTG